MLKVHIKIDKIFTEEILENLTIRRANKIIRRWLEDVQVEAQSLTPVQYNALKGGFEIVQTGTSTRTQYKIVNNLEYAKLQHENTSFKHKVGQAKFLETAFKNKMGALERRARDAVNG